MKYIERALQVGKPEIAKKLPVQPASLDGRAAGTAGDKTVFGFWVDIMTDCVLFASLFATYIVLRFNTYGGPSGRDLFSLPFVLTETLILLTSSFTCGMALLASRRQDKNLALKFLAATFLLGAAFLFLELREFSHLYNEGNSWRRSGFLTGFFTLVGTHGAHITAGLIWMAVMMTRIYRTGFFKSSAQKMAMFAMFWHFLDVVWIFIFTIVYMFGAVQ